MIFCLLIAPFLGSTKTLATCKLALQVENVFINDLNFAIAQIVHFLAFHDRGLGSVAR
jgi:hypothetical protein